MPLIIYAMTLVRLSGLDFPPVVDLGIVKDNEPFEMPVGFTNDAEARTRVDLTSACGCLTIEPKILRLAAGESAAATLRLDPAGYAEEIEKIVMVTSSADGGKKSFIIVKAFVDTTPTVTAETETGTGCPECKELEHLFMMERLRSDLGEKTVHAEMFYSAGCRSCERLLERKIPEIEKRSGMSFQIEIFNILEEDEFGYMNDRLENLGVEAREFPLMIVGDRVLQGEREIEDSLGRTDVSGAEGSPGAESGSSGGGILSSRLAPIPVLTAGLIDGINPCAFTTLLFLVSTLTVVGRSRRETLVTGSVFAAAVFITYFSVGLGFFTIVRTASSFPIIASLIRWILFAVLVVFAGMSLYDAWLARHGRSSEILLQLPGAFKKRIHETIRSQARTSSIIAGAVVMGFLVSIFELACTGQVYLPTITYMVKARGNAGSYFLLLLYNIGFIIPLLAVFGLVYTGTGSKTIVNAFSRSLSGVKVALALVFAGLAVLTLIT